MRQQQHIKGRHPQKQLILPQPQNDTYPILPQTRRRTPVTNKPWCGARGVPPCSVSWPPWPLWSWGLLVGKNNKNNNNNNSDHNQRPLYHHIKQRLWNSHLTPALSAPTNHLPPPPYGVSFLMACLWPLRSPPVWRPWPWCGPVGP